MATDQRTQENKAAESTIGDLMGRFPHAGRLVWIGVRPERRLALRSLTQVKATAGTGLEGDHYRPGRRGLREVTLIQAEHLPVIGSLLGMQAPPASILRRNLVIAGINLLALKGTRFRVGSVLLEGTGPCHPCSRMEEALGPGGYNAMRGHGGLNARIVEDGFMRLGDHVRVECRVGRDRADGV